MANPHRGSVALQAGDRAYTVSFSINALCELEAHLGVPIAQIAEGMNSPEKVKLQDVRAVLWAGLQDNHEGLTIKEAGEAATLAGLPACMDAIGKAFELAFPQQEDDAKARPPKAKG